MDTSSDKISGEYSRTSTLFLTQHSYSIYFMITSTSRYLSRITFAGFGLVALFGLGLSGIAQDDGEQDGPTQNIVEIASETEELSTLVQALTAADLATTLAGEGPYTVLAPTNEAIEALPEGVVANLLMEENKEVLTDILTYHVLEGELDSGAISEAAGTEVATLNGDTVSITEEDGSLMVDGAMVTTADVEATNGVVHIIDSVLVPAGVDVSALAPEATGAAEEEDSEETMGENGMDTTVRSGGYSAPDHSGFYTILGATALIGSGILLRAQRD